MTNQLPTETKTHLVLYLTSDRAQVDEICLAIPDALAAVWEEWASQHGFEFIKGSDYQHKRDYRLKFPSRVENDDEGKAWAKVIELLDSAQRWAKTHHTSNEGFTFTIWLGNELYGVTLPLAL